MSGRHWLMSLLLFASTLLVVNGADIVYDDPETITQIADRIEVFTDTEKDLTIDDVYTSAQFTPYNKAFFEASACDCVHWIRITASNLSGEDMWLEFGNKLFTWYIDLYEYDSTSGRFINSSSLGSLRLSDTKRSTSRYIMKLASASEREPRTYYIRIESQFLITTPVRIGPKDLLVESGFVNTFFFAAFIGLVVSLFLYNLLIYFSTRDKNYLFYLFYLVCVGMVIPFDSGNPIIYNTWLWNNFFVWHDVFYIAIFMFAVSYLDLKKNLPVFYLASLIMVLILFPIIPIITFLDLVRLDQIVIPFQLLIMLFYLILLTGGIIMWRRGQTTARFFVLGWIFLVSSVIATILSINGIFSWETFGRHALYVGFGLEAIMFALALGDRLKVLVAENEEVQRKNLELISNQKMELEKRVEEKTRQLQEAYEETKKLNIDLSDTNVELNDSNDKLKEQQRQLEQTIGQLKAAQEQLIQSEKMASIGVLAAGVAHEINNPLNFIKGGAVFFEKYLQKKPELNDSELVNAIDGVNTGVRRASEIVKSLTSYSRSDASITENCDIHQVLDDSLTILKNQYKGYIEIIKQYEAKDYSLKANYSKLQQVFMNLITNSIHAMPDGGKIVISTQIKDEYLIVSITDSGSGVPRNIRKKIFDPFFTTKDPGKGTGLGLSISFNIVKEHKGQIEVQSTKDKGTTMIIHLPVDVQSTESFA